MPTATYRVQFSAPTEPGAYSCAVTDENGALVEGITVTSLGDPVLKGYDVANAATTTFTVEFPDLEISGADKGSLNIVFNTQVTIGYLNVTLTPTFSETVKTYGDPDDWTDKFDVTPSTDAAIGEFNLKALDYKGALGRALYNASGFVRAGKADDAVNAMLDAGADEYYAAYVSARYTVNDPSILVTVDEAALKDIRFTVNAREIVIGTYGKDKEVPDGTANVPYADGERAVFIQNLVSGDDAFLTWTSAVYVDEEGNIITKDLATGGVTGLRRRVSDRGARIPGAQVRRHRHHQGLRRDNEDRSRDEYQNRPKRQRVQPPRAVRLHGRVLRVQCGSRRCRPLRRRRGQLHRAPHLLRRGSARDEFRRGR